jgi:large conductance mechanosensitive channel
MNSVATKTTKTKTREFRDFLTRQNVVGLAVAVIIGLAVGRVVNALVADIIMPLVNPITPGGDWKDYTVGLGSVRFGIGHLLGAFLDFIIIGLVAFFVMRAITRRLAPPAEPTKTCPECCETVLAGAHRCKYCGAELAVAQGS